jgi:hypothetical protein
MKLKYGFTVFHAKEFKAARGEFAGWPDDKYRVLLVDLGQASAGVMAANNCSLPNLEYERDYRGGKKPQETAPRFGVWALLSSLSHAASS